MKKEELVRKLMAAFAEKGINRSYYSVASENMKQLRYLAKLHLK